MNSSPDCGLFSGHFTLVSGCDLQQKSTKVAVNAPFQDYKGSINLTSSKSRVELSWWSRRFTTSENKYLFRQVGLVPHISPLIIKKYPSAAGCQTSSCFLFKTLNFGFSLWYPGTTETSRFPPLLFWAVEVPTFFPLSYFLSLLVVLSLHSLFAFVPLQNQVCVQSLATRTTTPSTAGPLTSREPVSTYWLVTVAAPPLEDQEITSTSTAQTPASW